MGIGSFVDKRLPFQRARVHHIETGTRTPVRGTEVAFDFLRVFGGVPVESQSVFVGRQARVEKLSEGVLQQRK